MRERSSFGSKFGAIAAATGSAIGLGNIWRFPYVAGENGGAAFMLVYLFFVIVIGIPMMLSEFSIGRYTNRNTFGAFRVLRPGSKWYLIGILGIVTAFVILSFYSVVAGWTIDFLKESLVNGFAGRSSAEIKTGFDSFVESGWRPVFWTLLFVAATAFIVVSGIEKGIERYNKILMPLLFLILIGLGINSATMEGFREGMSFLFKPDFGKITGSVVIEALGQAFFSLSLGMGTMITSGSYTRSREIMLPPAGPAAVSDPLSATLAGVAIFPAVFSFGISPTSGPDLVFITLPNIFQQMPGGYVLSILFFLLLFIAAVTSSVSLMEVVTAFCTEELKMKRRTAVLAISLVLAGTSTLCTLSQMPDSPLKIAGTNLFDFFDNVSATYMMPVGAFFIAIFTGWFFGKNRLRGEFTSGELYGTGLFPFFLFLVRFIAPVVIAVIFLSKAGWLKL